MNVDVVIVGGGPAGCSSALTLILNGYSVAIVDADKRTEKPTETASHHLKPLLNALNAESTLSACEPCYGISTDWGRDTPVFQSSILNPFGHAWFIHRTRFDSCLRQLVRDQKATWIEASVQCAEFNSKGIKITTDYADIQAKWVIAATGSTVWPARITNQKSKAIDLMIAFWGYVPKNLEERLLYVETIADGWWYICPTDGMGMNACFVTDAKAARKLRLLQGSNLNKLFQTTELHRRLNINTDMSLIKTMHTGLAELPQRSGRGWIAVGDSAVKLDPLGSSGTLTALDSGYRAGMAISLALQGDLSSIDRYEFWSKSLLKDFIKQREPQYAIEKNRYKNDFWTRRILSENFLESVSV